MPTRNQRLERKAAGLCTYCGKNEAAENRSNCRVCLDKRKKTWHESWKTIDLPRQQERRAKLKAAGICTTCRHSPAIVNQTKCRDCSNDAINALNKKREFVYAAYGNKCSCPPCGETCWKFLVLDHINGKGRQHRKEAGDLIKWAFKNGCPPILRLLCANCNTGRERNNKICPHLS